MASTYELIKAGWLNKLKYNSLSESEKESIQRKAKICMGEKDDLSEKCDHFTYSPVFKMVERMIRVLKKVPVFNQTTQKHEVIDHPNGVTEIKTQRITTGEVVGAEGYKCGKCGCEFSALISSPEKKCPIGKF